MNCADNMKALAHAWRERSDRMGLTRGTKKHWELQLEYFIGAARFAQIAEIEFNENWLICISIGRDSSDLAEMTA